MCKLCCREEAQPLTAESLTEFREEGLSELLVELEGKTYNDEDLYHCDNYKECGFRTSSYHDLNDGLCEVCVEEAKEYTAYVEDVQWGYRNSIL